MSINTIPQIQNLIPLQNESSEAVNFAAALQVTIKFIYSLFILAYSKFCDKRPSIFLSISTVTTMLHGRSLGCLSVLNFANGSFVNHVKLSWFLQCAYFFYQLGLYHRNLNDLGKSDVLFCILFQQKTIISNAAIKSMSIPPSGSIISLLMSS